MNSERTLCWFESKITGGSVAKFVIDVCTRIRAPLVATPSACVVSMNILLVVNGLLRHLGVRSWRNIAITLKMPLSGSKREIASSFDSFSYHCCSWTDGKQDGEATEVRIRGTVVR